MFDSMRTGDIPLNMKEGIASLLCTTKKSISLVFPGVLSHDLLNEAYVDLLLCYHCCHLFGVLSLFESRENHAAVACTACN